jgi:hypothetical protein
MSVPGFLILSIFLFLTAVTSVHAEGEMSPTPVPTPTPAPSQASNQQVSTNVEQSQNNSQTQNQNNNQSSNQNTNVSTGAVTTTAAAGTPVVTAAVPVKETVITQAAAPQVITQAQTPVKELPKTGLPLAAWGLASLLPGVLGINQFRKKKHQSSDSPNSLWIEKQFKK